MYSAKELLKIVNVEFKQAFLHYGYKKFASREFEYYKGLNNGFLGFIGFGHYSKGFSGVQFLNTVYCISNREVQETMASLMELSHRKDLLRCSMRGLSSLVPESDYNSLELKVSNSYDISLAAKTVCGYIENYIDPFFNDNDNWDAYKDLVLRGKMVTFSSERDAVIPVIYYLDGQKEKGIEYIEQRIKANLDHPERAYGGNVYEKAFLKNYMAL